MKNSILTILTFISIISFAKTPTLYVKRSYFKDINQKTFVEQYAAIDGATVYWKSVGDKQYQASIQIGILVTDSNENVMYAYKYNVISPIEADSLNTKEFINQHRFYLNPGVYKLLLEIKDNNSPTNNTIVQNRKIMVPSFTDSICFSSISNLQSVSNSTNEQSVFYKNGFDMLPFISDMYGQDLDKIQVYGEIYQSDRYLGNGTPCMVKYYVRDKFTKRMLPDFVNFSRVKAEPIVPFIGQIPIQNLESGNYELVMELIDKNNKVWAQKQVLFSRFNKNTFNQLVNTDVQIENTFISKYKNMDTIAEYIKCLRPIANNIQKTFIDNFKSENSTLEMRQNFFYSFWFEKNKLNPEVAWNAYKESVNYVNKVYKSLNLKGYSTDRGRVYLQYGKPDYVTKFDHEPSTYPYEIWQYNQMAQRTNCRFVFYNPVLADNTYPLIHSEAVNEMRNDRWQVLISNRNLKNTNVDNVNAPTDQWGNRIQEFFENPR